MRIKSLAMLGFVLVVCMGSLHADPLLYTIGSDTNFVPRSFTSISVNGSLVTSLFNLGDGSLGFDGGLTYDPNSGLFYAAANDGSGNSTLQSFSLGGAGTLSPVSTLGTGFLSGLTFDSADGNLYAIEDDTGGFSSLFRIPLSGSPVTDVKTLGLFFEGGGLFTGGLTFDPASGLFYAMGADTNGVSRVFYSISLIGAVTPLFNLGDGSLSFNGGLVFNPGDGLFYVISNDSNDISTLDSFSLAGGGAFTPILDLGQGFNNVGLAEVASVPAPASVPEPSAWVLVMTAFAGFVAARNRSARRFQQRIRR